MNTKIIAGRLLFIIHHSSLIVVLALLLASSQVSTAQEGWTPVYNDGCSGEGHRVLVGKITARATLGDGCDLVVGYVAPGQRYADEWVWGYSPTAGTVSGAEPGDAASFRPHICDVLPRFPWPRTSAWRTRVVEPKDFLYALYGRDYPAYVAASCRLREHNPSYAQIGLDRTLRPGSKLAEPPASLVTLYNRAILPRERVSLPVPAGRLTVVVPGDSLSLFARVFDVSQAEIQAANHLVDPNALLVGQMLLIPGAAAEEERRPPTGLLCRLPAVENWSPLRRFCGSRPAVRPRCPTPCYSGATRPRYDAW